MIHSIKHFGILSCLALFCGCTSITSTMLNRLDDNSFQGNSNGFAKLFKKTRPYKGVPITLKVPSHLDVEIEETYYMTMKDGRMHELLSDTRILDVDTKVVLTDKVFTVDFKRPGSGTLNLGLEFTEEQNFSSISSELDDTTIVDAAALAAQVIDSVSAIATASSSSSITDDEASLLAKNGIMKDTRTVAFKRFDINAVDFEIQVEEFVRHHLNSCNQCGILPAYDNPL